MNDDRITEIQQAVDDYRATLAARQCGTRAGHRLNDIVLALFPPAPATDYRRCPFCKAEQEYGGISGIGYACKSYMDCGGAMRRSELCKLNTGSVEVAP